VTDRALEWLATHADRPFFLFVHYFDPHYPYGTPAGEEEAYATPADLPRQKQLYAEEIARVDTQIGRIVDFLKERGLYEDSLIVVTADHGEGLGEHGSYYDHVRGAYDELTRIPLVLRGPTVRSSGVVFAGQVGLSDVPKTILTAVGLDATATDDANYDLIRLANERPAGFARPLLAHNFRPEVPFDRHAVRSDGWKLIRSDEPAPRFELYDLLDDPAERVNLFDQAGRPGELRAVVVRHAALLPRFETPHGPADIRDVPADRLNQLRSLGYLGGR
jgi:arylsulfatase A-like enzyme